MISKTIKHNFDNPKKLENYVQKRQQIEKEQQEQEYKSNVWKEYNSVQEEQQLFNRGYVLLIPYKRKRELRNWMKRKQERYPS